MQLTPYLNFNGTCEEAFTFYHKVLGGTLEAMMSHEGTPAAEHVPPEWRSKIMHARLNVNGQMLMGSDARPEHFDGVNGFSVTIGTKDIAEAERIFQALSEGATVRMPLQQTFWAPRFGMLTDRFGIPWMVNCEPAAA